MTTTITKRRTFPIHTDTACKLKWAWSSLYLNTGRTASCWRTGWSDITADNFDQFHNTARKIEDRESMLRGEWPDHSCAYCRNIETAGGFSDRQRHNALADLVPSELDSDARAVIVTPQVVEVYFSNTCNLRCIYCNPGLSSAINQEYKRHGTWQSHGVRLEPHENRLRDLQPAFWQWFATGFAKIQRLHVLGGEPLLMREMSTLLDYIRQHPNPNCTLHLVTNLMIDHARLETYVHTLRELVADGALRGVDISCSIDCWGSAQEYVRQDIDLVLWKQNFERLMQERWMQLSISQVVTPLTVKTMPELLEYLAVWRQQRPIGHWFGDAGEGPSYMKINILGDLFSADFQRILDLMPTDTEQHQLAWNSMHGLWQRSRSTGRVDSEVRNLIVYLDELDRRRGTSWNTIWPWLEEYRYLLQGDTDVVV